MDEFARVLSPSGTLYYKIPDGSRSHGRVAHYEDVLESARRVDLTLDSFHRHVSRGLLSNANVKRGRAASIIFELRFVKKP
jgi:hypothetical protein